MKLIHKDTGITVSTDTFDTAFLKRWELKRLGFVEQKDIPPGIVEFMTRSRTLIKLENWEGCGCTYEKYVEENLADPNRIDTNHGEPSIIHAVSQDNIVYRIGDTVTNILNDLTFRIISFRHNGKQWVAEVSHNFFTTLSLLRVKIRYFKNTVNGSIYTEAEFRNVPKASAEVFVEVEVVEKFKGYRVTHNSI